MRARPLVPVVAAVVVLAFRFFSAPIEGLPAVAIPQGMSPITIEGKRLFLDRQGNVFTALDARSGFQGEQVVWCPYEELFWGGKAGDIFDRRGVHARGPAEQNMISYPARFNAERALEVDLDRPGRAPGERAAVTDEILTFYERYLNQTNIPGSRPLIFCPNPVR